MFQDCLDHEVAELIVDQDLNAFEGYTDELLLPLSLRRCDAVFNHLAAMLVSRNLRKVLDNGFVND